MLRKTSYRPTFMHLEDRAVPGTVLTRPDLSAALGTTLALSLDLSGSDAIAIASYEAQLHSQSGVDLGDQTPEQGGTVAPVQRTNTFGDFDPRLGPANDLNGN